MSNTRFLFWGCLRAIWSRLPGFEIRKTSLNTVGLSRQTLSTPFETTRSTEASGNGNDSICPRRNITSITPSREASRRAWTVISGVSSMPISSPFGLTLFAARTVSNPAPQPSSMTVWERWTGSEGPPTPCLKGWAWTGSMSEQGSATLIRRRRLFDLLEYRSVDSTAESDFGCDDVLAASRHDAGDRLPTRRSRI
jgi:hypothetical protein